MSVLEICKKARAASYEVAKLSGEAKNAALCRMANALEANARHCARRQGPVSSP